MTCQLALKFGHVLRFESFNYVSHEILRRFNVANWTIFPKSLNLSGPKLSVAKFDRHETNVTRHRYLKQLKQHRVLILISDRS